VKTLKRNSGICIKKRRKYDGGYSIEMTAILDDVQGFCFDCNKQTDIEYDDEYVEEEL